MGFRRRAGGGTWCLNGKILTADSPDQNNFTIAQAAAIYDGKFIVVGSNEEALEYAGPSTRKIDVGGRTVIPGLVELITTFMVTDHTSFPKESGKSRSKFLP